MNRKNNKRFRCVAINRINLNNKTTSNGPKYELIFFINSKNLWKHFMTEDCTLTEIIGVIKIIFFLKGYNEISGKGAIPLFDLTLGFINTQKFHNKICGFNMRFLSLLDSLTSSHYIPWSE